MDKPVASVKPKAINLWIWQMAPIAPSISLKSIKQLKAPTPSLLTLASDINNQVTIASSATNMNHKQPQPDTIITGKLAVQALKGDSQTSDIVKNKDCFYIV